MPRNIVTEKLESKVLSMYDRLKDLHKVAKQIGLGSSTVHRVLKRNSVECVGLDLYRKKIRKLPPSDALRAEYESGLYLSEIAKKYGVCNATAQEAVKKSGAVMNRRGQQRRVYTEEEKARVLELRQEGWTQTAIAQEVGLSQTVVSHMLIAKGVYDGKRASGEKHGSWNGGRVRIHGYVGVAIRPEDPMHCMSHGNNYVLEHRIVMARSLGRALFAHETVHHIDGNRANNKLSNLQLRFGKHGKGVVMACAQCGSHEITYKALA